MKNIFNYLYIDNPKIFWTYVIILVLIILATAIIVCREVKNDNK